MNPAHPPPALTLATYQVPRYRDVYDLHRDAEALADGISGRMLWASPRPGVLIIQAAGRLPAPDTAVDYAARLDALRPGSPVSWSLIGNPVKADPRIGPDGRHVRGIRGTRRPLPEGEREAWARRKLDGALDITHLVHHPLPTAAGSHPRDKSRIRHARHAYAGTATVTAPAVLAARIRSGIGPGKAFGCGLLIIRPEGAPA